MKITLMYNPKAGNKGLAVEELVEGLTKRGAEVKTQDTKKDDYEETLEEKSDFIIIAGGDGTVEKLAKLMIHKKTPIAILPFGSANNIANSLDVEKTFDSIIKSWENKDFSKFSVGSIILNQKNKYFLESVGWGLFAEVLSKIKSKKKKRKKTPSSTKQSKVELGLNKLSEAVKDLQPSYYEILLDGEDRSGYYLWVEIMNTQSMGPQLQMAPDAKHGDDFLDVVLVKEEELENLKLFLNIHGQSGKNHDFKTLKAKNIRVKTLEPLHIDDEIFESKNPDKDWLEISLFSQFFWVINA